MILVVTDFDNRWRLFLRSKMEPCLTPPIFQKLKQICSVLRIFRLSFVRLRQSLNQLSLVSVLCTGWLKNWNKDREICLCRKEDF